MNPSFSITTERLTITHFDPSSDAHCDFLVALWNSPTFIASCGKTRIQTREDARHEISTNFLEAHKRNGYGIYLASLNSNNAKPIGTISLMRGNFTASDLGFAILPEEMRKGYAKEAAQGLLDWMEKERALRDVLGLFDPGNEGSKGVFRSLGFVDCGTKVLEEFGGNEVAIWVREGMSGDVEVYGVK